MFGFRDQFTYEACGPCGSIQIKDVPAPHVLSKYYPDEFWASKSSENGSAAKGLGYYLLGLLLHPRWRFIARLVCTRLPRSSFAQAIKYRINPTDKVLDVGCGPGNLIHALAKLGLPNPIGVDPFIDRDIVYRNGARVVRTSLDSLHEEGFDVIMFHHSLEHVPDPILTLSHAGQRLRPGGLCIVRLPTASSEAFELFKEDWVQLDPPRHLHIPSREGMRIMAEINGMRLEDVVDDSSAFQFWGSEQYRKDIPLRDSRSYFVNPSAGLFSAEDIASYEKRAQALNETHRGDQAIFFLRKL